MDDLRGNAWRLDGKGESSHLSIFRFIDKISLLLGRLASRGLGGGGIAEEADGERPEESERGILLIMIINNMYTLRARPDS